MSETLRETIEKAFAEHMHYYELYAEESDRGSGAVFQTQDRPNPTDPRERYLTYFAGR